MTIKELVKSVTNLTTLFISADKARWFITGRNGLKTKILLISLLTILGGCAGHSSKIDLKKIDSYPMHFHSSEIELYAIGEVDLISLYDNKVCIYKASDLLLLNLNIKNTSPYTIMIDRTSIYLLSENDEKFTSISGKDALEAYMDGWFGLKRFLVTPDIVYTCQANSIQRYKTIEPDESINTNVFFKVHEKKHDAAINGELFINIKKVKIFDNNQYKLITKKEKQKVRE